MGDIVDTIMWDLSSQACGSFTDIDKLSQSTLISINSSTEIIQTLKRTLSEYNQSCAQ